MAVHLFILYWGMLSFITPPVALGAFAAAAIAEAKPMLTGFKAMGLGASTYFIPFFFVLAPELVLVGEIQQTIASFIEALIGIWLIAGGIQGYLPLVGRLQWRRWLSGVALCVAGIAIALPGLSTVGIAITNIASAGVGAVLAVLTISAQVLLKRSQS